MVPNSKLWGWEHKNKFPNPLISSYALETRFIYYKQPTRIEHDSYCITVANVINLSYDVTVNNYHPYKWFKPWNIDINNHDNYVDVHNMYINEIYK